MAFPIMAKATAVWLVDNTTLTFKQIADYCGLHELEVGGIADGEVAIGIKGLDPVLNNQLAQEEIEKGQADPGYKLTLKRNPLAEPRKTRRGPRYTPLSRRQDRPAAISWLVKFHPELSDHQISKLIGTTKPTIRSIRERTHWNMSNIQPTDPVVLGLCKQTELDSAIQSAADKKVQDGSDQPDEEGKTLVSTEQSLQMEVEPRLPSSINGLKDFTLSDVQRKSREKDEDFVDAESFFNLPDDKPTE